MTTTAIVIGAGQSGIAAAFALRDNGFRPLVLEAGSDTAGSWPHYYDSLRLFTPAHFNALPGRPFPGDPDRYPTRDEVAAYLRTCAADLGDAVRTGHGVTSVVRDGSGYRLRTVDGAEFVAPVVVSATGSFANPHRPHIPGLARYTGRVMHAADYRTPAQLAGQRVVVVGSGNSAVQIAVELAAVADVILACRTPIRYASTEPIPARSRFWSLLASAARLPVGPLFGTGTIPVIDTDGYRNALRAGRPEVRDMPTAAAGTVLCWPDDRRDHVDTVVLATGYRPALPHLRAVITLDRNGFPRHRHGLSSTHPGLAFVGLEYQHTILSATLHGVGRDSRHVARRLARRYR
ncbi:NAD(P)/FAD-dependent oxidoreductase [Nocardia sp. BMG51109]|uniref:flavin-containing monooxygenase n=1 Tax=Nocardia sp. BMG51109 TaxID=1056816 RepID=UPI000466AF5F|nr:NAD(P)/FAD-dependent oxidoreductase [Nocardia sp. BMG51109]